MYAVEGVHLETVKELVKYDFIKYGEEKNVRLDVQFLFDFYG